MHRIAPLPVVATGPASLHQYLDQAREGERGEERYYTEDGQASPPRPAMIDPCCRRRFRWTISDT